MILYYQVQYHEKELRNDLSSFFVARQQAWRGAMTKEQIDYVKQCISTNIHKFYTWSEWEKVRAAVLHMDKYECQDCKRKGKYTKATTVHHNQFLKKHPELALDIFYEFKGKQYRNLVSLCHDCHEARHGFRKKEQRQPLTSERWD